MERSEDTLLFFFYGSLLRGLLNHHALAAYFGDSIRFAGRARTVARGHMFGLRSRAYPFLTFATSALAPAGAAPPACVVGELFEVDARCAEGLRRLDELEEGYARREVEVELLDAADAGSASGAAGAGSAAGAAAGQPAVRRAWLYAVDDPAAVADLWRQTAAAAPGRRPRLALVEDGDWARVGLRATGRADGVEEVIPDDEDEDGAGAAAGSGSMAAGLAPTESAR